MTTMSNHILRFIHTESERVVNAVSTIQTARDLSDAAA